MLRLALACILALALSGCMGNSTSFKRDLAAAQVPAMPPPQLDKRVLGDERDQAMPIRGTFTIHDGTLAEGDYPFEMRLGHDARNLFAFVAVHNVPNPNPFNGHDPEGRPDPSGRYGFALGMFLDTKLSEGLVGPEDLKFFTNLRADGSNTADGYWTGTDWAMQNEGNDPQHSNWPADNRPLSGTWGRGFYEGTDLFWEIYIPLKPASPEHDGFDPAASNGVFRMGLEFEVQGGKTPNGHWPWESPHDCFPGDGYTPDGFYDPSTWMRLQLA